MLDISFFSSDGEIQGFVYTYSIINYNYFIYLFKIHYRVESREFNQWLWLMYANNKNVKDESMSPVATYPIVPFMSGELVWFWEQFLVALERNLR